MAVGLVFGYSCHPQLRLNSSLLRRVSSVRLSCVAAIDGLDGLSTDSVIYNEGGVEGRKMASEWKKFSSNEFGITNSMIPKPTRIVLNGLKRKARILRAIRIAARLGFGFSRETAHAIKHLAHSVLLLYKGRHLMEMNYMLAYGSAEPSLRLLWRFGLLELLLPIQAAYFVGDGFRRRDKKTNMLLSLFSNMDKLLAPDRPCHSSLWVAILAFHMAVLDRPRDPLVIAAFSLAVHNGGDMEEAISLARKISKPHVTAYHELSESKNLEHKTLKKEVLELGSSVNTALSNMTDTYFVSQAMRSYPKAPYSDLVFISLHLYLKAVKIFECVNQVKEARFVPKQGGKIDYEMLALGSVQEVRHVFARIVFDTIYPLDLGKG